MILDACCGSLLMYRGMQKNLGDDLIYIDVRNLDEEQYHDLPTAKYRMKAIKPLVQADLRYLPFRDHVFRAVVCDPPHDNFRTGLLGRKYGYWKTDDIVRNMRIANDEFKRVLADGGFLFLKIFRKRFPLYETLLSHFRFFLPITRISQSSQSKVRVSWYLGALK